MPRCLRFSLANVLLAATCIALAIGWWATVKPPKPPDVWNGQPTDYGIRELPLTISMSVDHGLEQGWYFSVNSAGDGELTIPDEPKNIVQSVKVTPKQLTELRELLVREQFFALKDEYGQLVPDGGSQNLTVNVGEWSKSVRINYLMNWASDHDNEKLKEPNRALRVWILVRGWFQHPDASDSRPYDLHVINSVCSDSRDAKK